MERLMARETHKETAIDNNMGKKLLIDWVVSIIITAKEYVNLQ